MWTQKKESKKWKSKNYRHITNHIDEQEGPHNVKQCVDYANLEKLCCFIGDQLYHK